MNTSLHELILRSHENSQERECIERGVAGQLIPLEDLLSNDSRGTELKKIKDELAALSMQVRTEVERGMVASRCRDHAALIHAVTLAIVIVEAVWEERNGSRHSSSLHA